jgi:hypothetical protein
MDIFELKLQVTFDDVLFLLGCLGVFESKEAMAMYVKAPMKTRSRSCGLLQGSAAKTL